MKAVNKRQNILTPASDIKVSGELGERIDAVSRARLLGQQVWDGLYPQIMEAFLKRPDDAQKPDFGLWRGEFFGKYMLSCIDACRYYRDEELGQRILKGTRELIATQEQDGYIGTYADPMFVMGNTWNIWCAKYTLWGLIEVYRLTEEADILEAAVRFADNLIARVGTEACNIADTGNFHGMPSCSILCTIVELYRLSGEKRFLDFAEWIVSSQEARELPAFLKNSMTEKPIYQWKEPLWKTAKAYELMSCVEGLAELYAENGEESLLEAAIAIYRDIAEHEFNVVGACSFDDKFMGSKYFINTLSEICDCVYFNRLAYRLFLLTGESAYLDHMERCTFNALLCGESRDGSWGLRRLRMSHEHIPAHFHGLKGHQCCVDNLPRGLFMAAASMVFVEDSLGTVVLGLYAPYVCRVVTGGVEVGLEMKGSTWSPEPVALMISPKEPVEFCLKVRIPGFAEGITVTVKRSGKESAEESISGSGSWLAVRRLWREGDRVELHFKKKLHVEWFDPSHFTMEHALIKEVETVWPKMGLVKPGQEQQITGLTKNDLLPHRKACAVLIGNMVLARDARLEEDARQEAVFEPLPKDFTEDMISAVKPIEAPEGIRHAFEMLLKNGMRYRLCDFASAGNTWDAGSRFNTWFLLEQ